MTEDAFVAGRKAHLINKLRVVKESLARDLPRDHAIWKTRILIPMIKAAIDRIKNGTYGRCMACDEPIEKRRLILRPEVICCATCQTEFEGNLRSSASA